MVRAVRIPNFLEPVDNRAHIHIHTLVEAVHDLNSLTARSQAAGPVAIKRYRTT
jgi:hypothetical protein